jgi:CRP-like cAMP-binding protein
MQHWHEILIRKFQEHSALSKADISAIRTLPGKQRSLIRNEDILRQGDRPRDSAVVLKGMVGRYHTVRSGKRQYLSFHIAGDMPDAQMLFLESMDHSLCAISNAVIVLVPHASIIDLFEKMPAVGFSIWRETLIDASIFRQAITNNSARGLQMRLAHFFCEQYYRADKNGLVKSGDCKLPLTQTQLAETLASSLPSINRTLVKLRKSETMEFENGILRIFDWNALVKIGDFNSSYLHLEKPKKS